MTPAVTAIIVLACAAAVVCAALFLFWCNNSIQTTRFTFKTVRAERELKIVQLSDLHGKNFGAHNAKLIKKVMALSPDVIAVTGDIIHDYRPAHKSAALGLVSALSQIAPVLYVSGNHEMRNMGYTRFKKELADAGAEVLDNRTVTVCGFTVTGLNGAHNKNGTLSRISADAPYKILLAHMPQYIKNYSDCGYDLVLCGHAHGGQWRIPIVNRGIYAPGQGLFPKYFAGVYKSGKTEMVVSRGLGNSEFPFRLFNRPEIVEIIIKPDGAKDGTE